ncbi:hypothetical protein Tco_0931361, partial [Tanacetum coccineum]
ASRKHLYLNPIRDSIFQSIFGKGYRSFGQALFKSLKSMHILQLPSGFLTRTGLATQVGYHTFLTIPALSHSATSSLTIFLLSRAMISFPLHPRLYVWVGLEFVLCNEKGNSSYVCQSLSESIGMLPYYFIEFGSTLKGQVSFDSNGLVRIVVMNDHDVF